MRNLKPLLILLCIALISCAVTKETMTRPDGSTYSYFAGQVGGAGESHGSSGAGQTFDGQKSLQDLLTAAGVGISAWSYASQQAVKFAYQKYQAGQITQQQFNSQIAALQQAELAQKGVNYSTALEHGAVPTVGTVVP